jgi:hypothetical protein
MTRIETSRKNSSKNRYSKRTRDVGSIPLITSTPIELDTEPTAPRVDLIETTPVSPEYQDKWNEILRQTMTKKQLKNFLGQSSKDED